MKGQPGRYDKEAMRKFRKNYDEVFGKKKTVKPKDKEKKPEGK